MVKKINIVALFLILFICISDLNFSQWAYDPSANTKLVVNPNDPVNIISIADGKGGSFIVWQDVKIGNKSDIFFLHVNKDGEVSFRSDGKSVSVSANVKTNPGAQLLSSGELIIFWIEKISSNASEIFAQKVTSKGLRLWSDNGTQVTKLYKDLKEYSFTFDKAGKPILACIAKDISNLESSISITQLNSEGQIIQEANEIIISSLNAISECQIHYANDNSLLITWLETKNSRATLNFGKIKNISEPIMLLRKEISRSGENVFNYQSAVSGNNLYLIRYSQEKQRVIYHHMLDENGNFLWGKDGALLTTKRGQNYNPQISISNNKIFVSWVNDYGKDKNIYAQLFDFRGNKLWKESAIPVIEFEGDQFGQKVISDGRGNFIVAWIDRRFTKQFGNIYAQKLDETGQMQWLESGVDLGTYQNSEKSYLNLISDNQGGAIAIFKDKRDNKSEIFGQKIYSTGTYAGQILGLKAEFDGDSVLIMWYAANEKPDCKYEVQKTVNSPDNWYSVAEIAKGELSSINYYEVRDFPGSSGVISYRVIQKSENNQQISEAVTLEILKEVGDYILHQNIPNPFSDNTIISFTIPNEEYVEIELFDIKLNSLGTIVQKIFPAGKNSVTFDAKRLASGVYFYKMRAGDFVAVKKMVISK